MLKCTGEKKAAKQIETDLHYGPYSEATARYGVGRTTLRGLVRSEKIRGVRVGKRALIDYRSADSYFAKLPHAA